MLRLVAGLVIGTCALYPALQAGTFYSHAFGKEYAVTVTEAVLARAEMGGRGG